MLAEYCKNSEPASGEDLQTRSSRAGRQFAVCLTWVIRIGVLKPLKRQLYEFARCTRHNWLHLHRFSIGYRGDDLWTIRHNQGELRSTTYPYLAMHDIEGYMKNGEWSLEPGMVVVDAGGCLGEFTLYASQCVGETGRVIMLEPDAANIEQAARNFAANGNPSNITVLKAGLWNAKGTIRFTTGLSAQSSIVDETTPAGGGKIVEIPTTTLADLVTDLNLSRLDFVKMDIEGAELEAISAAKLLPAGMKPRYAIASYHLRDGVPTAGRMEQMLGELGYQTASGNPRHLTTWGWTRE